MNEEVPEELQEIQLDRFDLLSTNENRPIERSGQRIFADEDYLYMVGGYNPRPERTLTDAWRFNRLTGEWQQCTLADPDSPLPNTLASFSLVSRGPPPDCNNGSNEAYIFGGTKVPFGGQSNSNRLYWIRIDQHGKVHVKLQSINGTFALPHIYGQGMCRRIEYNARGRAREVLYIMGGTTGVDFFMDVYRLERPINATQEESWELTKLNEHNSDEVGRYRLEMVPYGRKLFTFGGSISDRFFVGFKTLTIFNLDTKQFERIPTKADNNHGFPRERSCHSIVHRGDMVYLLGGRNMEMDIFSQIWTFDLDTLQWRRLSTSLPTPVFFHSAALTPDGCIFVFGGVTRRNSRVNDLQRMWIKPPSLSYFAKTKLIRMLPMDFLTRFTNDGIRLNDTMFFPYSLLNLLPNCGVSQQKEGTV